MREKQINKIKQLIREGHTGIQDILVDAMMSLKRNNIDLTHEEVMDLFQNEVDKFLQYHRKDRTNLPSPNRQRVIKDKMPYMKIPYGNKKKKGF